MELWVEFRSLINRSEVKLLADARVAVLQVGIESLSTNVLRCMRKSVTALQNIYCLKLCRTYGVCPTWNLLVRVPGEQCDDYREMADLIPKIVHLTPPMDGPAPVQMHRFSPYFNETGRWADNVRPWKFYQGLYPQDRVDIAKIVYYFEADWKNVLKTDQPYREVSEITDAWREAWRVRTALPILAFENLSGGGMELTDTREQAAARVLELGPWEADVFRTIDDPNIAAGVSQAMGAKAGGRNEIEAILGDFVSENLAIREQGYYLALAVPKGAPEPQSPFR